MIKKTFYEETMDTALTLLIGTEEEINKSTDVDITKSYGCMDDDTRTIIINMSEIKGGTMFMKTLVHELLHYVGYRLRSKRIDHTAITEEIYCYLYDFYFGKIREWMNKIKLMNTLKKMVKK